MLSHISNIYISGTDNTPSPTCYKMIKCGQTLVRDKIRYSSSSIISLQQEREGTWHDVIDLEQSRAVWKDLGSRRIRKNLEIGWYQGTRVPHGVHMMYAWTMEIKSRI